MLNQYALAKAIEASDFALARKVIDVWHNNPAGPDCAPLCLAYVSSYAMFAKDTEIRDFIAVHAEQWIISRNDNIDYLEGAALTFLHLGVAFLPDIEVATGWFDKALVAIPGLRPAMLEREILMRGLPRDRVVSSLGEQLPYQAWHYELAAAELRLPPEDRGNSEPGAPVAGIGIRGKCDEHTPALMRLYRRLAGDRPLLISTWDDTEPAILAELHDICDEIVLIPNVEDPGFQNRARQISLAQALLDACSKRCELTLITRTDIALFRPRVLDTLTNLWNQFPIRDERLRGRLIVPDMYTRRYLSDHPSDLIMFGATSDLQRYWASSPFGKDEHQTFIEQYLSRNFRMELDIHRHQYNLTPSQYMGYLRDYFIIRDFSWYQAWWLGRRRDLAIAAMAADYSSLVSQALWEQLYFDHPSGPIDIDWAPRMRGAMLHGIYRRSAR